MEKITFRGNAYLALQSNSEKLNEHRFFFLLREVSYCEKAFQKQQNMLLEKQRKLFKETKTTILV